MEILAPAGSPEALIPAVRCGADAVYLGASRFSARGSARNFDMAALQDAVAFCHTRDVKVHLALNTLIRDDEMADALHIAKDACDLGVDALIVQDLGLVRLLHKKAPGIPLHGSTQMSVHTPGGVRLLAEMGLQRVVLARELSYPEIKEIAASSPIELEVFVHGALCMSVSGQCYFSAMLGGRSGNRGQCAQTCRLPFSCPGGTGHDLSLKDLSLVEELPALQSLGIASAKIEGRMKRPEYVAAAVTACRCTLDGTEMPPHLLDQLEAVFSRSGFTKGYYHHALGRSMFGVRSKEDVAAASKVLGSLRSLYRTERQSVPVFMSCSVSSGKPVKLQIADTKGNHAEILGPVPVLADHVSLTAERVREQLAKTGGTPFQAEKIDVSVDGFVTISLSALNQMRRDALQRLSEQRATPHPIDFAEPIFSTYSPPTVEKTKIYGYFPSAEALPQDLSLFDLVFLPLETPLPLLRSFLDQGIPLGVEIPRGMFGTEKLLLQSLCQAKDAGISHVSCGTLGGIALAKQAGVRFLHGGLGLNLFNSASLDEAAALGLDDAELSFELSYKQIAHLGGPFHRGILVYGRIPLMLTRNCPLRNGTGCETCHRQGSLTDRMGIQFPVRCRNQCSEILNAVPLYELNQIGSIPPVHFHVFRFSVENSVEIGEILHNYRDRRKPGFSATHGLYRRGVE